MSSQYTINYFADTSTVTRKLDLDQTSMAHIHTEIHKYDKTHFSVRPRDFLHPSPIRSALYVAIMFEWSAYADFSGRFFCLLT